MNIPSQKSERLFVFEQVLQAHLVVHDGLEAFDTLVLYFVPRGVAKVKKNMYVDKK